MLQDASPFVRFCYLRPGEVGKAGINHMHRLGLLQNVLNPSNVMMVGTHAITIDFDSCRQEGQDLVGENIRQTRMAGHRKTQNMRYPMGE